MMIEKEVQAKLLEAYGYSDEQLLAEFEAAEKELEKHPELLEEFAPSKIEFEKIIEMVEQKRKENEKKKGFLAKVYDKFFRH